ncbi:MAG: hypothetical protein K0R68_3078 [Mycobacterium sp.]|nr:hypothetical protein [Mycobacterium sp.]
MVVVGAFAAAAVAAPLYAALSTPEPTSTQAECLAWLGSKGDGLCIGNGGFYTSPLMPGTSVKIPLG